MSNILRGTYLGRIAEEWANPSEDKRYYVYVWYYIDNGKGSPFYVGKGTKGRDKSKHSRSKAFSRFVETHECGSLILIDRLSDELAFNIEILVKQAVRDGGYTLLDGEDDLVQRKAAVREGIDRALARGVRLGRPSKNPDNFSEVYERQQRGELTLKEAMDAVGVGRTKWYELARAGS